MIRKLKVHISDTNRRKKYQMATSLINQKDTIIDIGVDPALGGNTNYFEKFYHLPNKLTCLGVQSDFTNFRQAFPDFELLLFDGINFPNFNEKFDFAFSNAVIEHVGPYEKQGVWLNEISRFTKLLFITTPNKWLPFETHTNTFFFHWFPDRIRNYCYCKMGKQRYTQNYMWLIGEKNFKQLLTNNGFEIINFYKNKFLLFTIDFVAICRSSELTSDINVPLNLKNIQSITEPITKG